MMGERSGSQGRFFDRFDLAKRVPADHLLRKIDAVLDLSRLRSQLGFVNSAPIASSACRSSAASHRRRKVISLRTGPIQTGLDTFPNDGSFQR